MTEVDCSVAINQALATRLHRGDLAQLTTQTCLVLHLPEQRICAATTRVQVIISHFHVENITYLGKYYLFKIF